MKAVVIGAGVIGITTAYQLQKEGYEVHVVDAAERICAGASGMNACLLVPGDSGVWPAPGAPLQFFKEVLGLGDGTVRVRLAAVPKLMRFGLDFVRNCYPKRVRALTKASLLLSRYSSECLTTLLSDVAISFHHEKNGMVFLYKDAAALEKGKAAHNELALLGEEYRTLTPDQLVALDPAYSHIAPNIYAALYVPSCRSGDCGKFTRSLADHILEKGVCITLGKRVKRLSVHDNKVVGIELEDCSIKADIVVLAAGHGSAELLRPYTHLPMVPVRGFSITVPIVKPENVPNTGGYDDLTHCAYAKIGDKLRIATGAEFLAGQSKHSPHRFTALKNAAERLFPGSAFDWDQAVHSVGERPLMSRDVPVIGSTRVSNLFLNTGHGHLGWTQACGSAAMLADLIAGRPPGLAPGPYMLAGQ